MRLNIIRNPCIFYPHTSFISSYYMKLLSTLLHVSVAYCSHHQGLTVLQKQDHCMHYSTEKVFKDYTSGIKTLGFHSIKNRRYLIRQEFGDSLSHSKFSCINTLLILYISTDCCKRLVCIYMLTIYQYMIRCFCLHNIVSPR